MAYIRDTRSGIINQVPWRFAKRMVELPGNVWQFCSQYEWARQEAGK